MIEWINATDELPPKQTAVLVAHRDDDTYYDYCVTYLHEEMGDNTLGFRFPMSYLTGPNRSGMILDKATTKWAFIYPPSYDATENMKSRNRIGELRQQEK